MVLTLRNRLPFTRVHSHAVAQKSSGAFFRVMARERCWKWLTRYRVALRAFQAVQTTDVMVNLTHWQVQKKPCGAFFVMLMRKLLLLRIHFLNVIVHNRSELHWCLDVWNWRVGSAGTFNYDRPIIKDSS